MNETSTVENPLQKIIETLTSPLQVRTVTNLENSSYRSRMRLGTENFRRNWINKRLALDHHHPDVVTLENSVFDFCQGIATNPRHGKKFVIYGNNGVAKTHCCHVIEKWVKDRAMDLQLVDSEHGLRLIDCVMANWAETVDRFKTGDWSIDEMADASVLLLDDIGAEHDPTRAGVAKLYLLLEKREKKWTFITTNVSPGGWERQFDRRVRDRLFRNSTHVDLTKVSSYSVNT